MKKNFKNFVLILMAFVLLFSLANCTPSQDDEGANENLRLVTDAVGRQVYIPKTVTSIVCVNVGALRFTSYMGAQDLVVGVEQNEKDPNPAKLFSYLNKELFADLPHTGDNGQTYDETIIGLSPDVIIAAADEGQANELAEKLQIPLVAIPIIDSVFDEDIPLALRVLGEVFEKGQRAENLISYIDDIKTDLEERTKDIENSPTVYVGGINFKGARDIGGTEANFAPLSAISAINLADEVADFGAITIDKEQILSWDPDILFIDFSGLPLIKEDYQKNPDFYNSLSAVKNGRVYSQIPFRYNAVNLEIALADAYYAGKVVFPDRFSDINLEEKADEIYQKFLDQKAYDILKTAGYEFKEMTDMLIAD